MAGNVSPVFSVRRRCPTKSARFASFDYAGFNGRALGDDALDVMLTLAANQALSDGVAPDRQRMRGEFPYFGEPFTHDEQHGPIASRHSLRQSDIAQHQKIVLTVIIVDGLAGHQGGMMKLTGKWALITGGNSVHRPGHLPAFSLGVEGG